MDENHFNKSSSSSMEHGVGCEEPAVCQLTHDASMARLKRLWKALARRAEKSEFEEVTLCGPKVAGFLSEQLGSGCAWVRYAALDLLCGAVPRLGDSLLLPLVPRALSAAAHAPSPLRLKALHFLRALRKHSTDHLHSLCTYYLENGLESGHEGLSIACIHGASVVFDEDLEEPQHALLLPALARPLTRPPGPAYLPAFRALRRFHARIGDARFRAHVRNAPHYADLLVFEESDAYLALDGAASIAALVDAYQRKRRRLRLGLAFGVADPALLEAMKKNGDGGKLEAAIREAEWGEADMEAHVPDLLRMVAGMMREGGAGMMREAGLGIVRELTSRLGIAMAPHLERVVRALLEGGGRCERAVGRLMREVHPMTVLLEVLRVGGGAEWTVKMVAARIQRLPYYYLDIMTLCRCMGQWSSERGSGASKECLDLLMEIIDNSPLPDLKAQVLNTLIRDKILQPRPLWSSEGERRAQGHTADEQRAERAARNMYGGRGVEEESLASTQVPDDFELATPTTDVTSERKGEGDAEEEQPRRKEEKAEVGAGEPSPCSSEATLNDQQIHCQVKRMNPKKYNFNILKITTPPETPQSVLELEAGDEAASEISVHPSSVLEPDTPDPHSKVLRKRYPSSSPYEKVSPKESGSSVEDFTERYEEAESPYHEEVVSEGESLYHSVISEAESPYQEVVSEAESPYQEVVSEAESPYQEVASEAKDSITSVDDQTANLKMSDCEETLDGVRRRLEEEDVVHMTNFSDHSCYEYISESDALEGAQKEGPEERLENADLPLGSKKSAPKKSQSAATKKVTEPKRRTSPEECPAKEAPKAVEQISQASKKPFLKRRSIRGGHTVGDSLETHKVVAPKRPLKGDSKKPIEEKLIQQQQDIEEDSLEDVPKKSLPKLSPLALDGPKERGDFEFDPPAIEEEEEIVVPPASYPLNDISEDSPPFRKGRELPRTPVKVSEKSDLIPEKSPTVVKKPRKKPLKVSIKKSEPAVTTKKTVSKAPAVEEEVEAEIEEQVEEDKGVGESAYKGSQWRRDLEYASKGGECAWARSFEVSALRLRPFESEDAAETALKRALDDLEGPHWKAKEEAMSCVIRCAKHHPVLVGEQVGRLVVALCGEVKNFRQSVAGKAILTAGHLYVLMGRQLESKLRVVVGALLSKSGNRTLAAYFRLVIRSLFQIIQHSSLPKAALAFLKEGSKHANKASRETAAQFLAVMTENLGWKGALSPPMAPHMLRAAHAFAFDCSPLTRYCGKRMLRVLTGCPHLDRLREQQLDIDASASLGKVLDHIEDRGVAEELLPIHLIK